MKIIGKDDSGYIATFGHTELEKFLNLYYGKLESLKIGSVVDLGAGYDHASDIRDAMRKTEDFIRGNERVIEAIINGLTIKSNSEDRDMH